MALLRWTYHEGGIVHGANTLLSPAEESDNLPLTAQLAHRLAFAWHRTIGNVSLCSSFSVYLFIPILFPLLGRPISFYWPRQFIQIACILTYLYVHTSLIYLVSLLLVFLRFFSVGHRIRLL